jgi:Tol biopolymer transport system component
VAVLPGDDWIAYMEVTRPDPNAPRTLRLVRPDGSDDHVFVDPADLPSSAVAYPSWSADGSEIAFIAFAANRDPGGLTFTRSEVWVASVVGGDARRIAACEDPCIQLGYPDFSPDGTELAFIRYDLMPDRTWGPSFLDVLDLATGERRVVSQTEDGVTAYYEPSWSPDGKWIVVALETYTDATESITTGSRLAVVAADGSSIQPSLVTPADLLAGTPDWGPGDSIVFAVPESVEGWADTRQMYTIEADGSDLRQLTTDDQVPYTTDPVWTADGSRIVFSTGPKSGGEQWLASIDANGSGLREESWKLQFPSGVWRTAHQLRPIP